MLWALLRQYVRPYRSLLGIVAVFQVISTLASLYLPTINAAIIDDGVAKGDSGTITELGGMMLAVTAGQVVCAVGAVYFGSRAGMGFGRDLRSAIFHHVTGLSAQETARFGAPTLLTRTTNDVQQIQLLVQMTCTMLITAPIMSVGGIAMAVHQDAGLSWLLLVSVPVLAVANYWIVSHLLPLFRTMQRLIDNINRVMREQLSGIRVIRAFAREPFERARFGEAKPGVVGHRAHGRTLAGVDAARDHTGDQRVQRGADLVRRHADRRRPDAGRLADRIPVLLHADPHGGAAGDHHPGDPAACVRVRRTHQRRASHRPRDRQPSSNPCGPTRSAARSRWSGATFCYPGADRPVLQDVSFIARPGTTTAVVGSTGSGKSTLISLICRLFDVTDGAVRIDGVDVRDYDVEQLWATIGLVPQRGYLFSGTVAENLRFGKADATADEMWEALRVAAADGFVAAHPDGLDMPVAQGGINFSGGQRQRLAIARAVIRRPAIYLFDDAFSALDVRTDARVRAALREVAATATVLIVSQRISTVAEADHAVVVDDGMVVGMGTHDSLLADCPIYAEFADSQAVAGSARPATSDSARDAR